MIILKELFFLVIIYIKKMNPLKKIQISNNFFKIIFIFSVIFNLIYFSWVLKISIPHTGSQAIFGSLIFLLILWFIKDLFISSYGNFLLFSTSFVLQILWWNYVDTKPISDFLSLYEFALNFSKTFNFVFLQESKSPIVTLYYAIFLFLFGPTIISGVIASSIAWSMQAVIIKSIMQILGSPPKFSLLTSIAYSFSPAIIFYSPVISYEGPAILAILITILFALKISEAPKNFHLFIFGLLISISYLSRANSLLILLPLLLFSFQFINNKNLLNLRMLLVVLCGLIIPLFLQFYLNYHFKNILSFNSNTQFLTVLLMGTNLNSFGIYNEHDLKLLSLNNQEIINVVLHRILDNPIDFFKMALGPKLLNLWGGDGFSVFWSSYHNPPISNNNIYFFYQLAGVGMITMLLIAIFTSITCLYLIFINKYEISSRDTLLLWSTMTALLCLSILQIFIEAQGRYHLITYPLIAISLGVSLKKCSEHFGKSRMK
jgi:hypothetical protein